MLKPETSNKKKTKKKQKKQKKNTPEREQMLILDLFFKILHPNINCKIIFQTIMKV